METAQTMTCDELSDIYRGYIAYLNAQAWDRLGHFVHEAAEYSGTFIGLTGYRSMPEAISGLFRICVS